MEETKRPKFLGFQLIKLNRAVGESSPDRLDEDMSHAYECTHHDVFGRQKEVQVPIHVIDRDWET